MSPWIIILLIAAYFGVLMLISKLTADDSNDGFFIGKRNSPWYIVAFGMIGASLSGVTFISVPGWVGNDEFSYMQMVIGYVPGYMIIATVLMPVYYRLNLTSIYTYLENRFGLNTYKAGASFFLISRLIGASFRLYLVAIVLQYALFTKAGIEVPFVIPVLITIALIWLYTKNGGIKTIIWTDTLQTLFMLLAVVITLGVIAAHYDLGFGGLVTKVANSDYSQIFFWDAYDDKNFFKNFFAGVFMAIVMTGLDQDMMQKNLSCRNIKEAQKNMIWFSVVLVFVNLLFLSLGALLYIFAGDIGLMIPEKADELYSTIALDGHLGSAVALFFILGLIAAAYSSADSALTALTTSFCIDILNVKEKSTGAQIRIRKRVHIMVSVLLMAVILVFHAINDDSVIKEMFTAAAFTYGPLLGLFSFGFFTKKSIADGRVWFVVIAAPAMSYVLKKYSALWFGGYEFGFEILLVNGALTFLGLLAIPKK